MEYISVAAASEKWGVSIRQVQRLLAGNRIPRAEKYGRSWMIPIDAKKPIDPRREKHLKTSLSSDLTHLLATTSIPVPINNPNAIFDTFREDRLSLQYEGEFAYLRGDFARTMRCFQRTRGDDASRLRASLVAIAASISLGDYHAYTEIDAYLKNCIKTNESRDVVAFAEMALATAAVSVIAPKMAPDWLKDGDFSSLSEHARPNALYLRAKYFQCAHQYETALTIAQTALSLCASEQMITVTDIYLGVTCAVAYYYLGRVEEAERALIKVMRVALPHGFITPFAEVITGLGGLVERCLEQTFPGYYAAVLGQWKQTWKNWITFHNQFTKENITLMLSLREYHIALLVTRRVPYARIADQYDISVGRLKNIMQEIYEKLYISGRDELAQYVF